MTNVNWRYSPNKEIIKKVLKRALIFYLIVMVVALLVREFSPLSFWHHNPFNPYNQFTELIFPYLFLVALFFGGALLPFNLEFYSNIIGSLGIAMFFVIISILINLIIYFTIFLFVYVYFSKRQSLEKTIFTKFIRLFGRFWFLGIILGAILSYLFYSELSFQHSYPHSSHREHKICEEAVEVKHKSGIIITEKGVCFRKKMCKNINGIDCVNLDRGREQYNGYRIVDGLNKENFDFEILNRDKYDIVKIKIRGDEKSYVLNVGNFTNIFDGYAIGDIDVNTFQYLGGKYSKDKSNVYYKDKIILADPETFNYKKGGGKTVGKGMDRNGTWITGVLQKK